MQANVGPNIEPGRDRSDTPPDHKSISAGCLQVDRMCDDLCLRCKVTGEHYSKMLE